MTTEAAQVWKTIATALITFIIGFFLHMFLTVGYATKDDLAGAVTTIQRQLDYHSEQLGELRAGVNRLDVTTGRIAEHIGVRGEDQDPVLQPLHRK